MKTPDPSLPLHGIRVLELGRVPPAELPGMMLADLGADVLKIDTPAPPGAADASRHEAFAHTNRNKRSIALNLKSAAGREIFMQLARDADVLIEGFRPGVMRRLGADYDTLRAANPKLVYCSLSGFGQTGPYRDRPAHDLNFLALSGALALWGKAGHPPDIPLNLVADYGGAAMHGAFAIMAALFARERGAPGQHIDISYLESTVALLAATPNLRRTLSEGRTGSAGEGVFCGGYPYYTLYPTADDRFLSVACSEPHLWRNFCESIGKPSLAHWARKADHYLRGPDAAESAARLEVAAVIRARACSYWEGFFERMDVCVAPVRGVPEMLDDPHLRERGLLAQANHPVHGPITQFASPLRMSGSAARAAEPAPAAGEHTNQVLGTLGMEAPAIAALREQGVVA